MKLTVAFQNSQVVLAVDVSPEMNVQDFMAYALDEAGFPLTSSTTLQWQNQALEREKALQEYGINDDDMVIIASGPVQPQAASTQRRAAAGQSRPNQSGRISAAQVEQMRQEILYDPNLFTEFSEKMPELAASIHDAEEFAQGIAERQVMMEMQGGLTGGLANLQRALNPTPEMLAQKELDENRLKAMEEMPESFVPVTMLYVELEINGHPIKAFVDSGAQSTILSPECAKKCGLEHLIDKRYKGTAYGVGTSEIIGRIHMAPIKIGSGYFPCGFTVLEGIKMDMLFGLDMLRHHQAVISLQQNALILGDESVPFLGEADLPESAKAPNPLGDAAQPQPAQVPKPPQTQPAPASTEPRPQRNTVGDNSQPTGSSQPAISNTLPQGYQQEAPPQHQHNQHAPAPQAFQPPAGPPPSNFNDEAIANLISFGFPREKVLNALQRAGGNAEIAASILFDES